MFVIWVALKIIFPNITIIFGNIICGWIYMHYVCTIYALVSIYKGE